KGDGVPAPLDGMGHVDPRQQKRQRPGAGRGVEVEQLQAASCKLQAASCKLQAASCKLQAASCKLQAASCKLQAASESGWSRPNPVKQLRCAFYLPLIARSLRLLVSVPAGAIHQLDRLGLTLAGDFHRNAVGLEAAPGGDFLGRCDRRVG